MTKVKQRVYVVGPRDNLLDDMWANNPAYALCANVNYADIVCFQGGPDVNPDLYGEKKLPRTYIDPSRDKIDMNAWEKSLKKPKVGICRGGQFLNVMSEGEMYQDVNNHMAGHEAINLLEIPDTHWNHGTLVEVTSDHHQMMIPNLDYAEVLCIAEKSTTFVSEFQRETPKYDTEVVWYDHTQSLCFQPHPEYQSRYQTRAYFFSLLKYLIG